MNGLTRIAAAASAAVAFALPAAAQEVADCDWRARADAIVEPWDQNSRRFANGDVRVALMDVIEPAAGALHILVLSPPFDELGGRQCKVISWQGTLGFSGARFGDMLASYNPARGLTLGMDVQIPTPEGGFAPRYLELTINQATGFIDARLFN
ncbi:MAG: hypothetical protein AAF618_02900 [Pseudomonadota bacterium]